MKLLLCFSEGKVVKAEILRFAQSDRKKQKDRKNKNKILRHSLLPFIKNSRNLLTVRFQI